MSSSHSRAVSTSCLDERIATNAKAQKVDFNGWIFSHIRVQPGAKVLELCSGTGAQATHLARAAGQGGRLVSCDASETSLEKLKAATADLACPVDTLCCDMDGLPQELEKSGCPKRHFDLLFCSYGLYYSKNTAKLLDGLLPWLAPAARIVVVGPHGDNNGPLFNVLRQAGVTLDAFTLHSSGTYMYGELIPWCAAHSPEMRAFTMENEIHWDSPDAFMTYWRNTIFFESERQDAVEDIVRRHFEASPVFINRKLVMAFESVLP